MDTLIVERDSEVQALLGFLLEDGHPYTCGLDAAAAVRWLDAHPAGVLVLLGNFVGVRRTGAWDDGVALLRALDVREAFWQRNAVVVLVAQPDHLSADIAAIIARRHVCLLPKPFELNAFVGTLAACARTLAAVAPAVMEHV